MISFIDENSHFDVKSLVTDKPVRKNRNCILISTGEHMSKDKVIDINTKKVGKPSEVMTRGEIIETIEQGQKSAKMLMDAISSNVTELANVNHMLGRWQEHLASMPEPEPPKEAG